ncbi:helix-turn-helix domain-containing protein [Aristophania vespae]|uniref:Helix-turn-helix domain-containing protein n=1 Tax=Aristophania vespae TaxID=2697033 RepID=A0A6P1NI40_9PROT|nr:Crp/Fnr family transcriptional regulator [Aristophania vespae]QHI96200.1 helix-turn-helix domain-containing protein [Aristophania vespae]UMM63994.1 Nitrogen fixation regulation protein FixK [Aristophania vespae]
MVALDGIPVRDCTYCCGRTKSICNAIEEKDLPRLLAASSRLHLPSGRIFIEEGESAQAFYVIAEGRAKLFNLFSDGRRQISGFVATGDFLGLAASERYAFSAEALGDIKLCRFAYETMDHLTEQFPHLQKRLRAEASRELVKMQARLVLLGRKSARERLASFFIEQACCSEDGLEEALNQRKNLSIPPVISLFLPMSRSDIADYLGLTIETVSRTLKIFKAEGLIKIQDVKTVTLLNTVRLKFISEGNN